MGRTAGQVKQFASLQPRHGFRHGARPDHGVAAAAATAELVVGRGDGGLHVQHAFYALDGDFAGYMVAGHGFAFAQDDANHFQLVRLEQRPGSGLSQGAAIGLYADSLSGLCVFQCHDRFYLQ